jgi:carboxypeptidase C (cathepsin A)
MTPSNQRAGLCAALGSAILAVGAVSNVPAQTMPTSPDPSSITHGQVDLGTQTLHYSAQSGLLPLYDNDTGTLMGRIFVVAYTLDRAANEAPRPLTFIWNGGPGSSSSELHVIGMGPRTFKTPDTFPEWFKSPPTQLGDNPETWLQNSDLVFVDPIGTGYSRATSEAYRDILYTTHADIEAVAEAIRIYVLRNAAWNAPLFLAGESYGTERAMGVAEALERRRVHVCGVVLLSGFFDVGQQIPHTLEAALAVPTFAATAYYHKRLSPDLQSKSRSDVLKRALEWAHKDYLHALEHPTALTPTEKTAILKTLKDFTGIEPGAVDATSLELTPSSFADDAIPGHALGRYDMRMVGPKRGADNPIWVPTTDASIEPVLDIMQGRAPALLYYLRDTLQFKSDLFYAGPFGEAFHPLPLQAIAPQIWGPYDDWMTFKFNHVKSGLADSDGTSKAAFVSQPPLRHAMDLNSHLLVMNVSGLYDDAVGSCAVRDEEVARADPAIRNRVRDFCYDAGHMVYSDLGVRKALQRDFAQFVRDASSATSKSAAR